MHTTWRLASSQQQPMAGLLLTKKRHFRPEMRSRPAAGGQFKHTITIRRGVAIHASKSPKDGNESGHESLSGEEVDIVLSFFSSLAARHAKLSGTEHTADAGSDMGGAGVRGLEAAVVAVAGEALVVEHISWDPFPGFKPEPLSAVEPLAQAPQPAGKPDKGKKGGSKNAGSGGSSSGSEVEVVISAEKLAADVASNAAGVAGAGQVAAQDVEQWTEEAVQSTARDAADVAGALQVAARDAQKQTTESVLGATSDAADVAASVPAAVQMAGQQALENVLGAFSDLVSDTADMAGAMQTAAEAVEQQAACAAMAKAKPKTAPAPAPPPPPTSILATSDMREVEIATTKQALVGMLASLDRGAATTDDQAQRVDALAHQLERLGGSVVLSWARPAGDSKVTMGLLDGRWRLLYSSGFASGSLGGRRPGPSFGSGPFTLGQVYQDILTEQSQLNNVVDLFLRYSFASLPGLNAAVPTAHASLKHTFSIVGSNTVEITFTETEVKLAGGLGGWLDSLPQFTLPSLPESLQLPKGLRSARFDVVYLDEQMRITRGDRGELRVFLKGEP